MRNRLATACVVVFTVGGPLILASRAQENRASAIQHEGAGLPARPTGADFPRRYPRNEAEFDKMFDELKNWGRWGKDDTRGTINLITDAKRAQAAALVKSGVSVSLAHDLMTADAPDNRNPLIHKMNEGFRTDVYTFNYHGQGMTHFDALCHQAQKDVLYNGIPGSASNEHGCAIGVEAFRDGIVTRGILIDIPRLRRVPWIEPGTPIYPEEVEAWEKQTGLNIGTGDAIFLRYGRWVRRAQRGAWQALGNAAGFHASIGPWLKARDVALVAAENTAEAQTEPPYMTEGVRMPLHVFLVAGLGMPIIDDVDLDAVAETAARLNRWEFMVVIAPLRVPGGTGGPINPVAIF